MATQTSGITAATGDGIELNDLRTDNNGTGNHATGDISAPQNLTGLDQGPANSTGRQKPSWKDIRELYSVGTKRLAAWWSKNISLTINHSQVDPESHDRDPLVHDHALDIHTNDFRDYLALERTYLSHLRTAIALSGFGVVIVQLFVLRGLDPAVGRVLGSVCACGSMAFMLVGGYRYFQQQKKLTQGKFITGGLGLWIDGVILLSILISIFLLVVVLK